MRGPVLLISLALVATSASLGAQCPDGTPAPCAEARANRSPDPNRMVFLPFRVTTADTLLGEGFAELLAAEFTREGLPQAVDMATVLGSWRAAGGRLRAPLTRERSTRLARSLGAALVSDGSIVGLGKQITINVALVSSTTGDPRTSTIRISGSADSLDVALRRTTSALMNALAGATLVPQGGRYTSSPEAMQSYLEGLALWRRGRHNDAALRFDAAIALDSTFAQAVFRRAQAASWQIPGPTVYSYSALEWKLRDKLSTAERLVVETILGPNYPERWRGAPRLAAFDRLVALLPDSPDALFQAGDDWYHYGSFTDPSLHMQRAKAYFSRSVAIDSQPLVIGHLIEVAVHTADTALVRAALRGYRAGPDSSRFARQWLGAAAIGDNATLAALRRERIVTSAVAPGGGLAWFADMSAAHLEEFFDRWGSAMTPARRSGLRRYYGSVLLSRGRPDAAMRVRETLLGADRIALDSDWLGLAMGGAPTGSLPVDDVARRVASAPSDSLGAGQRCALLIWKRGSLAASDSAALRADSRCVWALDVLSLPTDGSAPTLEKIARADSTMVHGFGSVQPYEPYIVARAWEANGQPARALRAIRNRGAGSGSGVSYHPWTLAYEGQLAAQVGDTAGAVYAWRKWLGMMRDAEPTVSAKRDSVRADLARLTRKPPS